MIPALEGSVAGDLIRTLPAAILFAVLPGFFWAACLNARAGVAERLAFSTAYSMALVSPATLLLAYLFDTSVTLPVAAFSAFAVFAAGLVAYLGFGSPDEPAGRMFPAPGMAGASALVLLSLALGLALVVYFASEETGWHAPATALLVLAAGVAARVKTPRLIPVEPSREAQSPSGLAWAVRAAALPVVLALTLARGYSGVVLHDWPYLRGGDQFNHAVMANEMLSQGHYDAYLAAYPPGFAILTAGVSRLSGLEPLEIFPALAPALILLPALACYALAKRLWGFECGVAAAALSGLLLGGTYANIEQARYPNLVSSQFLLVLAVAALVVLYRSPSRRSVLAFALLGSSVVFYHPVASFYAVLLFALVSGLILPYLLFRYRREGLFLLASLALLGLFAVAYAWSTYDLPGLIGGLFTGSGSGASGESISIVIGTQPALDLSSLPERIGPPVLWLGLLGLLLSTVGGNEPLLPQRLARVTMLLWCVVLFVGSRTALSGFPQRFERDLGIPLAILAAFALVAVLRPLAERASDRARARRATEVDDSRPVTAAVASVLALVLIGAWGWTSLVDAASPVPGAVLAPEVATAGEWLRDHNTGGKIVPTPAYGSVPSRGMLAMGGYDGLQAYPERRVRTPRSLPPAGVREIKDAQWLLLHPRSERARRIVDRYDVRYVALYKNYPGVDPRAFGSRPDLYREEFQNDAVVIFAPRDPSNRQGSRDVRDRGSIRRSVESNADEIANSLAHPAMRTAIIQS